MEIVMQSSVFDEGFVDFDSWCQDMTSHQFYPDDSFFSKQGQIVQKNMSSKTSYHTATTIKHEPLPPFETMDARVPEYEASRSSISNDMRTLKHHPHKSNSWNAYFSKSPLVGIPSEDSVSQLSTFAPESENETFQDLTELLEQEYPLSKVTPPHSLGHELHTLEVPCSSSSHIAAQQSDESQNSLIGSFAVDLSPESPPLRVEGRYKEMRRKNNIASKNARVARREKERQMEERAKQLVEDNQALRIKVRKMEELAQELKNRLIQSVTRNK